MSSAQTKILTGLGLLTIIIVGVAAYLLSVSKTPVKHQPTVPTPQPTTSEALPNPFDEEANYQNPFGEEIDYQNPFEATSAAEENQPYENPFEALR